MQLKSKYGLIVKNISKSYPFAEKQSVYSTALADWARAHLFAHS